MSAALDLRCKKAGNLMAMSPTDKRIGHKIIWDCVCRCGRHRLVPSHKFSQKLITGCRDCDPVGRPKTRLGLSDSPEYQAWTDIKDRWPDFQEFLRALGLRPEGYQIGRLDPEKPHGPGNTSWVPCFSYVGQKRGSLRVLYVIWIDGEPFYRCICDCWRSVLRPTRKGFAPGSHCGDISHSMTHGHCRGPKNSRTFVSWSRMLTRCNNPKSERYRTYGARGVTVCQRWRRFEDFLADMGPRPEGKTLGRFLDRGNYGPDNCAWMTRAEQGLNMRNNNALKKWESAQVLGMGVGFVRPIRNLGSACRPLVAKTSVMLVFR